MPDLTIENVPDELLERLRRSAEKHRRSLSGEVIERLSASVPPAPSIDVEAVLEDLRAFRARLKAPPLTDEFIERAIEEGRP